MLVDTPLTAILENLRAQRRVWIRVAATKPQFEWQLCLLEVTTGEAPPSWRRGRWQYPRASFIASSPSGTTIARWLTRSRISLPQLAVTLDPIDPVHGERRESSASSVFESLPWPTDVWNVQPRSQPVETIHDELVAADAPAFVSFDQAAATFFGVPPAPGRAFAGRELVIRDQDLRGRIDSVHVRPARILVSVSGQRLAGTQLTLGGLDGPRERLTARTRHVQLPLEAGLQPGAWLALHRGDELLDRRLLDPSWGPRNFETEYEDEMDASTRLEVIIGGGETLMTEFKESLPERDATGLLKTVAAFANGGGGTIILGVRDDGTILGIDDAQIARSLDRLTNLITESVRPLVDFHLERAAISGRTVIELTVQRGANAPYGVGSTERKVAYYIRRGATTFPAAPADVREFVQSRIPRAEPHFPLRRRR
jgi:hypothetical protein